MKSKIKKNIFMIYETVFRSKRKHAKYC